MATLPKSTQWLSRHEVHENFGFGHVSLIRWRKHCLALKRPICCKRIRTASGQLCWHYAVNDLERISQIRQKSYPTSKDYLTAKEAKQEFGLSPSTLAGWASNIHPALKRKLKSKTETRGFSKGPGSKEVTLFSRKDIEACCSDPRSNDDRRLTAEEVSQLLGGSVTPTTVHAWRESCPGLNGRAIKHRRKYFRKGGKSIRKVWLYSARDIDELKHQLESQGATFQWLTAKEAEKEFGIGRATLREWIFRKCPVLGRKIKSRVEPEPLGEGIKHRRTDLRVFLRSDLEQIKNDRSSVNGRKQQKASDDWLSSVSAKAEFRINPKTLRTWLLVGNCAPLGRPIRPKKESGELRDGRFMKIWWFHRDDLKQIAGIGNPPPSDTLNPAESNGNASGEATPDLMAAWDFSTGSASYGNTPIKATGITRRLLIALANSGRPLSLPELITAGWTDPADQATKGDLENKLKILRHALRQSFDLPAEANPIPATGRYPDTTWRLAITAK